MKSPLTQLCRENKKQNPHESDFASIILHFDSNSVEE